MKVFVMFLPDCPNRLKNVSGMLGSPLMVKIGEIVWNPPETFNIFTYLPSYLNQGQGYYMRIPDSGIPKNTTITIEVTGNAKIYVAFNDIGAIDNSGGYEESLPKNGWKHEKGFIRTAGGGSFDIYSITVQKETKILLPATTTDVVYPIIAVVSICSGKSFSTKS